MVYQSTIDTTSILANVAGLTRGTKNDLIHLGCLKWYYFKTSSQALTNFLPVAHESQTPSVCSLGQKENWCALSLTFPYLNLNETNVMLNNKYKIKKKIIIVLLKENKNTEKESDESINGIFKLNIFSRDPIIILHFFRT